MEKIVQATPEDYEQMVAIGNICFQGDGGIMEKRWCHVWGGHLPGSSKEYLDNFFLSKDGDVIMGMIAVCPMKLEWQGETIQAGGISAVGTHPDYRGRGVMSGLLAHVDRVMHERGDVISVLGGDRRRYGRHGWEHVGHQVTLKYNGRYLDRLPLSEKGFFLVDYENRESLDQILRFYRRREPRFQRTIEKLAVLLQRQGVQFWAAGDLEAYIGARDDAIYEYGGDPEFVPALVKHFARTNAFPEVEVVVPKRFGILEEKLYGWASEYRIGRLFSLKILRLSELLEKLLPVLRLKARDGSLKNGRLTLGLLETGEKVTVSEDGQSITLGPVSGEPDAETLRLSRRSMARLLFGPFHHGVLSLSEHGCRNPVSGGSPGLLDLFPLPLFCSQIDMV